MKLERFFGKPKTYKIGGEEIELKPLTVKELDLLMDLADKEKQGSAMRKLITKTLQKTFPEAKEEELDNVSIEYFADLVNAIMDVNNIPIDEETKKKVLQLRQQKQES